MGNHAWHTSELQPRVPKCQAAWARKAEQKNGMHVEEGREKGMVARHGHTSHSVPMKHCEFARRKEFRIGELVQEKEIQRDQQTDRATEEAGRQTHVQCAAVCGSVCSYKPQNYRNNRTIQKYGMSCCLRQQPRPKRRQRENATRNAQQN